MILVNDIEGEIISSLFIIRLGMSISWRWKRKMERKESQVVDCALFCTIAIA